MAAADLVVVLHQLDDHSDVVAVILDGDDPHDVGSILHRYVIFISYLYLLFLKL